MNHIKDVLIVLFQFLFRFDIYMENLYQLESITKRLYSLKNEYFGSYHNIQIPTIHKRLIKYKLEREMFYQYFNLERNSILKLSTLYTCIYIDKDGEITIFDKPKQAYFCMCNIKISIEAGISFTEL